LQEKSPLRVQTNTVCGYGFPAPKDKKEYIMFFVWDSVSQAYVRVDHLGEYASQALISLEDISYTDFLLEHDLTAKQITDEEKENISKPYLAIFIFFVLICFVFCMKRRK
jgi:hypothetical protein